MIFVCRKAGTYTLVTAGPKLAPLLGCVADRELDLSGCVHPNDTLTDDCEVRLRRADGRYVWFRIAFEADRGALLDVSARRRLEAMGRLASGIAHEINTPVQFASDNVGFLRDSVKDLAPVFEQCPPALAEEADLEFLREELPRAAAEARRGLDRIAQMVKAMREYAPTENVVGVDVNAALETALVFTRHEYKYVADIDVSLGKVPLVLCHAGELHQELIDLVLDAARAGRDPSTRTRITAATSVEGDEVVVRVGGGALRLPVQLVKKQAA